MFGCCRNMMNKYLQTKIGIDSCMITPIKKKMHWKVSVSLMVVFNGTIGKWNKGELSADKWVSIEFPVDDCLNQKGVIEAAFVSKGGNKCHERNVKFLFNSVVEAEDDHEGVFDVEEPENLTYTFNTKNKPSGKISIQAEMMCVGGDDCAGVIYVTCTVMQSGKKSGIKRMFYIIIRQNFEIKLR